MSDEAILGNPPAVPKPESKTINSPFFSESWNSTELILLQDESLKVNPMNHSSHHAGVWVRPRTPSQHGSSQEPSSEAVWSTDARFHNWRFSSSQPQI